MADTDTVEKGVKDITLAGEPQLVKRDSRKTSLASQFILTGIVYDERMRDHEVSGHPECPDRITCIWDELVKAGVVDCCKRIEARHATMEEVLLVHSQSHYDTLQGTKDMSVEKLFHKSLRYNSVYLNPSSFACGLLAGGSVCELAKNILVGDLDNGAAIVRPPGHHAEQYKPMGFCLFNSIAMAAKMAVEDFGLSRVAIIDWDIHHGNGTQHMFYEDERVLYISLHRYDNGMFYPASEDANYDRCGSGKGTGYNVNIPWNSEKMGDAEYMAAFCNIILPILYEYNPELVLVSCGLDSGLGDPLGGYEVSPAGYGQMTHLLRGFADGKLLVALEGGYSLSTLSRSMVAIMEVLLGDTPRMSDQNPVPNASAMKTIRDTANHLSKYWKSLSHWSTLPEIDNPVSSNPAPLTEDSMASDHHQEKPSTSEEATSNTLGRTIPPDNLVPEAETPPSGSVPVPSEKMPMSQAQSEIVKALELDGNVCMYAVTPLAWCEHLSTIVPFPAEGIDTQALCETCSTPRENWVCLTCHHVYCGRYINEHMVKHFEETKHNIVLSYADLSVWCNTCESYVHNPVLFPYINTAHKHKFGVTSPRTEKES